MRGASLRMVFFDFRQLVFRQLTRKEKVKSRFPSWAWRTIMGQTSGAAFSASPIFQDEVGCRQPEKSRSKFTMR